MGEKDVRQGHGMKLGGVASAVLMGLGLAGCGGGSNVKSTPPPASGSGGGGTSNNTLVVGARSDRKSTRLNSSHMSISYAVFCLKKKKQHHDRPTPRHRQLGHLRPA